MISIFEGRIGGGKTYLAVARILAHLAKGGAVYTNVELKVEGVAAYLRKNHSLELDPSAIHVLTEEDTWDFHRHLRSGTSLNTLVVIDEAHLWFNARDHAITANTKRELMTFLSQSRKLNVDVVFIVQAADNLDVQFRRLAAEIWRMKDLQRFRVPLLGIGYPWPHTLAFRLDAGSGQVMQKKLLLRSPDIFNAYNTNALLRPVTFAGEVEEVRRLKACEKKRPTLLAWEPSQETIIWSACAALCLLRVAYG